MKKVVVLLCLFWGVNSSFSIAQKRTVAGVSFPAKVEVAEKTLIYNGAGLREKYMIDLYVSALYLKRPSMDANKIIEDDALMGIHIELVSNKVTRDKFVETVREGFEKASHGTATSEEIKLFMDAFSAAFKKGDKIHLNYVPGRGTYVKKNGQVLTRVPGLEFKKALFSIWLGTRPADGTLKKGMLGKV
ncbi:MAG: chalcone isomerase [Bacteroidetes bacterium]|nr:MAG: chalcone isomerase [Bacteroidota bacterium]